MIPLGFPRLCASASAASRLTPRPSRRYLDSCNIPNTVKRKCGSSSCTSTSDEDRQQEANGNKGAFPGDFLD